LGHVGFPYLFLDATYLKVRDPDLHQVVSKAVVVATGITTAGDREILGLAVGDSEAETFWAEFLRSLRNRGLGGVRLVVSDDHKGLKAAIEAVLPGASWQRCRVHYADVWVMPTWTEVPLWDLGFVAVRSA
jgi:putative transposase